MAEAAARWWQQVGSAEAPQWQGGSAAVSSAAVKVGAAVGNDDKGGGGNGVVVKKNSLSIFSCLMFGREAICPDGLFVSALFQESDFYLNSLICFGRSGAYKNSPTKFWFCVSHEQKLRQKLTSPN